MDREAKTAKAKVGAKLSPVRRSRPRAAADTRSVEHRLADALAQQAATSEILRVMSASPTDIQPVMDAVAEQAASLCHSPFARVILAEGDLMRPLAHFSVDGEYPMAMNAVPLQRTSITGRAVLDRATVHHADVIPLLDTEFPAASGNARLGGMRAVLAVPLMHKGDAYGALFLWRREPGLFTPDQVALVETFATQAAIAIENVRLFHATREALEQQTATSEILRVISRSQTEVQQVFETIAANALRLCDARRSAIFRFDGELIHIAALRNLNSQGAEALRNAFPAPPSRGSPSRRAILTGGIVHIVDVRADPEYTHKDVAQAVDYRSVLSVPMLRDGQPIGTITVYRDVAKPFPDAQIELLKTFADQAVIAIENVRLFTELEVRNRDLTETLEQQTATSEILRVISSSPTDVQPVFETIAANALRLCDAQFSAIFRYDGELIHIGAFQNLDPEGATAFRTAYPCRPSRGGTTQRAILTGRIVHMPDISKDPEYVYQDVARAADYRSVLSVPMLRDGQPIGTITVYRNVARPFPDAQIDLLKTFADQAVIAIENVRLFTELGVRNRDLTTALDQRTATAEILRVISSSPTDVQPVFDAIVRSAVRLCGADHSIAARFDGELLHPLAHHGFSPEALQIVERMFPMRPGPENMLGRTAANRAIVNLPDMLADPTYSRDFAMAGGWRSGLGVPMLRDGELIGAIAVSRREPGAFPDHLVALLTTFADQAVIAIENVRLFSELELRNRDLTAALEQQTASSDILRVISQSQTDVQPVFDTIVRSVRSLCGAAFSGVYLLDGEDFSLVATDGMTADDLAAFKAGYPRRVGPDTVSGRAALECRVVQTPDLTADPDYASAPGARVGARTVLGVPLMRDNRAIGSIGVWRAEIKPFSESQIALLETFADQAVIAIENVRLFKELEIRNRDLTEALEQQTATSDILRVISQSQTDVQPVFDTIARAAHDLCGAHSANVFTYDGELVHLAAFVNEDPDYVEALRELYPRPLDRSTGVLRAIMTQSVVAIPDVVEDRDYVGALGVRSAAGGFRSVLAVPLLREGNAIGGIAVGRAEAGPFPEAQVALLQTFADQAVIAIENVRLFNELEARTRELTRSVGELKALGDVGQAVSSTLDLETVLSTIVSRATALAGMDAGAIYEYDEAREEFYLHTADRLQDEVVTALRAEPIRKGEGALGRMAISGEPAEIRDIVADASYQSRLREAVLRLGYRSLMAVPLMRDNHLLGGLVVYRKTPGEFDASVIDLLKTFATQSALAIQNARLFREIEIKSRQLETASQHKSEFLANMSHELRTPLNAIIGFSEVLSERLFGEMNEKQTEYVGDISESGRHLLNLINDILDLSKIEAGRMELDSSDFEIAATISNTLSLVRERAQRRSITLRSAVDPRLGKIHADERKVRQVLLNLLSNALKFTPEGGAIDVRATAHDDGTEIAVTDTGVGIAPEDQEAVFEEFRQVGSTAKKIEGTGLGLAISRKFIELHGGKIWVTSQVGAGSTFTFTLPLR
jgi:GAF domain-containing protein